MRATHLARQGTVSGPQRGLTQTMSLEERREAFDHAHLTWDGHRIQAGDDIVGKEPLKALMTHAGTDDLADALEKAEPCYIAWMAEHPGWQKAGLGGGGGAGGDWGNSKEAGELVLALAGTAVAGISAYIATDSLLRGIGSELNPKPCLEDVLEAYNQRLAYALGLDPSDGPLVTSMPRWSGLSGREHGRLSRLVRAGMATGLGLMVVSSLTALIVQAQGHASPPWAWPAFYSGAGALVGFGSVGWSVAW
jgi:hypothetical protein